jgi:hypothetical protein
MALSFALEPPYNANSVEYRYGAVCHGLGGFQAYVHGENGVEVRGHPAITQSCQEANGMIWWIVTSSHRQSGTHEKYRS